MNRGNARFPRVTWLKFSGIPLGALVHEHPAGEPIFWGAILIVLLSLGGGTLSVDNIIRLIARR